MSGLRVPLSSFATFGDLLKFLRRRAQLSQRDLSIAVGYSESQISRLENDQRPPDRASLLALFVPALQIQDEPEVVACLLKLAEDSRAAPTSETAVISAPLPAVPGAYLTPAPPSPAAPAASLPTLTGQQAMRNRLPVQLTSFIGRQEELAEVCDLLRNGGTRLVTLTGAGGCGKTRLALRVGEELAQEYAHGAWLVELASLSDPQLLPKAVASTFELSESTDHPLLSVLTDFLRPRQALLILDNCEHLVEAAAHLAEALLRACPQLQILATSRETLGVPGEVAFRVQPLALPPSQRGVQPSLAEVEGYDAIQLFVERARTALRTFTLTDQNAPAVARVCQRLDGIPLGIELAAAWVNLLRPEQIASRLEEDFDLLVGGGRTVLPRHQTLRATIEWSYNLLPEVERLLLRRLSVFVGGWTLEAAEAVATCTAGCPTPLTRKQVLNLLNRLVNKSLVVVDHSSEGEVRYRLLETIREYLQEKLAEAGEEEQLRDRHLAYFVALAEAAEPELKSHQQIVWLARLDQEQDNIRAALSWSLSQKKAGESLRLVGALGPYWRHRGHYTEGRRWLLTALAQSPEPSPARAQALLWAGMLTRMQGQMAEARPLCEESLFLFRRWNNSTGAAQALENLAWTYSNDDRPQAIRYFQESLAIFRALGCTVQSSRLLTTLAQMAREVSDFALAASQLHEALALLRVGDDPQGIAQALNGLAELASLAGDYDQAAQLLSESLELLTSAGSKQDLAWVHCGLAENCWHRGDFQAALQHGEISHRLFQELGSGMGLAIVLHHLGLAWLTLGNLEQTTHCLHESLDLCQAEKHTFMSARCLAGLGGVAVCRGEAMRAAQLLGAATANLAVYPLQLAPADEALYHLLTEEVRAQLDDAAFLAAWATGEAMSVEESVAYALGESTPWLSFA